MLGTTVLATQAKASDITVSFIGTNDPTSTSTDLDKTAHADGKVVVSAGETFSLPETSSALHTGEAGYQLLWYAEDGHVYRAGEAVSFTKDTRLFRCSAKEVYSADELLAAIKGDTLSAILMADIELTKMLETKGEQQCVLVLNGHTVNYSANSTFMGTQRAGKHIIGNGTVNITSPDNKIGQHAVFYSKSHSYNGNRNKSTVGVDVVINAPTFRLSDDGDGAYNTGYPWIRIFGTIDVYDLGRVCNGNRAPRVEIFETAEVTINGPCIFNDTTGGKMNSQQLQLTIYGGTFTLPPEAQHYGFWTNDIYDENVHTISEIHSLTALNADKILIYGGTFNVRLPDIVLGASGYAIEYDEATGTSTVVSKACTGTHDFVLAEPYEGAACDCVVAGFHYYRCECGAYAVQPADALGHSYTIIEIEEAATPTQNGVKRITCDRCGDNYTFKYAMSPLDMEVTITVRVNYRVKELTLLAGDLFDMTVEDGINGVLSTINGLKDGADYTKNDIIKIQIPAGDITLSTGALAELDSLEEIVLLDRADAVFKTGSIDSCPELKKITINDCTPVFEAKVIKDCPNMATLDLRLGNAVFGESAFELNPDIKEILMAAGKTYTFGKKAFRECGLTELIFPDNSIISWTNSSFAECQWLEYIYIGSNIGVKKIEDGQAVFDGISRLKKVVVMDLTYFGQWAFSGKEVGKQYGPLSDMTIYCHSQELKIHQNAFNNKNGDYHVYLYVVNPKLTASNYTNCNIVVYNGIGHGYSQDVIAPSTCVTQGAYGYATDCPCGIDYRENPYTTYSSFDESLHEVAHEPFGSEEESLPLSTEHTLSDTVIDVNFVNGPLHSGSRVFKCLYCDEASGQESEPSFPSMFIDYGYSCSTYGNGGIMHSYEINRAAEEEYFGISGKAMEYGIAACAQGVAADGILVNADGSPACEWASVNPLTRSTYNVFSVKLTGVKNHGDVGFYCVGYAIAGGKVYYIDDTEDPTKASAVTYNGLIKDIE